MKLRRRRPGYALATILVLLGVAMFGGAALVSVSTLESRISRSQREGLSAYYVAEGGVQDAIWRINRTQAYSDAVANGNLNVTYSVTDNPAPGQGYTVTMRSNAQSGSGYATIDVTGTVNNGVFTAQRRVVATVLQGTSGTAITSYSMLAGGAITINAGTINNNSNADFFTGGSFLVNGGNLNMGNKKIAARGSYTANGGGVSNLGGVNATSCAPNPSSGCGVPPAATTMPGFDFTCANYAGATSYTPAQFQSRITSGQSFPGPVTCVTGNVTGGSWMNNRALNVSGILIVNGNLTVNGSSMNVNVTNPGNFKSGIFVSGAFVTNGSNSNWSVSGLFYAGSSITMNGGSGNFNFTGAIISGGPITSNGMNFSLNYNAAYISNNLGGGAKALSVQYWEEEY